MSIVDSIQYVIEANIRDAAPTLTGKVLTKPALLLTDGTSLMYCCDVDIGYPSDIFGNPQYLRNVPIAENNKDLYYTDVGMAVTLTRTPSGQYRITGLSVEQPGTYIRYPVDLSTSTFGTPVDSTLGSRVLTFGELALYGGGFGIVPLGAIGMFQGSTLIRITT